MEHYLSLQRLAESIWKVSKRCWGAGMLGPTQAVLGIQAKAPSTASEGYYLKLSSSPVLGILSFKSSIVVQFQGLLYTMEDPHGQAMLF